MGTGSVVGSACDAEVGSAMTAGAGSDVGTAVGAATGSDFEVGVADPPHPTSARKVSVPSKSGVSRHLVRFSPLDFPLLISISHSATPATLGVIALILPELLDA